MVIIVAAFGLGLTCAPTMAQYHYVCPPGTYFAQGYGCVASPPPPVYYYAPPRQPPPVVYPAPYFGFNFVIGGRGRRGYRR